VRIRKSAKGAEEISRQIDALEDKISSMPAPTEPSPEAGMNIMRKAVAKNDLAKLAATPVAMTKSSQQRYRDVGGTSDQRTQLSTARWPCAPNSRWQLSLMRSGTRSGSSGPQAVKRTSDNIKSNILI
jgi:hypothetical protein